MGSSNAAWMRVGFAGNVGLAPATHEAHARTRGAKPRCACRDGGLTRQPARPRTPVIDGERVTAGEWGRRRELRRSAPALL